MKKINILFILILLSVQLTAQNVLLVDFGNNAISVDMESSFTQLGVSPTNLDSIPTFMSEYDVVFVLLHYGADQHILSWIEGTNLKNYLDEGGRVYMEGRDTWYLNVQTPVHGYFGIDSDNRNGSNRLTGIEGTSFDGLIYNDNGDVFRDYLHPISPAYAVLKGYCGQNCQDTAGVAKNADLYRTIGVSTEFQELVQWSETSPTKTILLAEVLNFLVYSVGTFEQINSADINVYYNYTNQSITIAPYS